MLDKDLQDYGLSDKEAKVYLAALELGQATVQQIAVKADVNRATTYVAIETLVNIGLMSSFYQGKKQFFVATSPERLLELVDTEKARLETRREKLVKIMPQLDSINNRKDNKPVVKYYEGKAGINAMNDEFMNTEASIMKMAYSVDAVRNFFSENERQDQIKKRKNKHIINQVIYTYEQGSRKDDDMSTRRQVPFAKFPISADITVAGSKIRLANLKNKIGGIIIEDKEIAESLAAILDLAWEASEKYENEKER